MAINGDTMFHGDSLNVHVSLTYFIVPYAAAVLLLMAKVIGEDMKTPDQAIGWSLINHRLLVSFLIMLPLLYMLLSTGQPHGTTDQIGVLIAIGQYFFIPFIIRPYHFSRQ